VENCLVTVGSLNIVLLIFIDYFCIEIRGFNFLQQGLDQTTISLVLQSQNHRITESQNVRGWKGPLWVI